MLPPRLRLVLGTAVACAVAAVAGVWIADSRGGGAGAVEATGHRFAGALRPAGARAPDLLALRDQDGRAVRMADLRGGPVVVTFIYSTCEDTCPTLVQSIRGALDRLGRDVPVLGVSVDPRNDTPQRARRFLLEQHMAGRMRFLLGDEGGLRPVWRAYGIAPQTGSEEHSAYVVVVDGEGAQRVGFPADGLTPEGLAGDLRRLGA